MKINYLIHYKFWLNIGIQLIHEKTIELILMIISTTCANDKSIMVILPTSAEIVEVAPHYLGSDSISRSEPLEGVT